MKNILHPDYWVEIPAGEFHTGFSPENEQIIAARMHEQLSEDYFSWKKRLLDHSPGHAHDLDWKPVYLDRFYIARFPIISGQMDAFTKGKEIADFPGFLNEEGQGGWIAQIKRVESEAFCKEIGARFPSDLEWQKAARGTDGRLYPWGNDWNPNAGHLYPDGELYRHIENVKRVNAFPLGVSPYGIYGMLGSLPVLTRSSVRGCDIKETTRERAWLDNIIPLANHWGGRLSFRPVLDKWPVQQWAGYTADA